MAETTSRDEPGAGRLLQLVLDNIPQFIFWKDLDSVYQGCNENFAEVAGVGQPEKIVGLTDFDLPWEKGEAEFFRECDRRVMDTGEPEYHIIEPQHQADGKHAWLDTNKVPLCDEAGAVVGILGTFEDITERIENEKELAEHRDRLEVLVKERTEELSRANEVLREALDQIGTLRGVIPTCPACKSLEARILEERRSGGQGRGRS